MWWTELEGLLTQGYEPIFNGLDEQAAALTSCTRCGHHRLEYRASRSRASSTDRSHCVTCASTGSSSSGQSIGLLHQPDGQRVCCSLHLRDL